jgi:small ligand-binding sensory domain FIST
MKWASALSSAPTPAQALAECASLTTALDPATVDLVFVFATPHYGIGWADIYPVVADLWPQALVLGCAAAGVAGGGREIEGRRGLGVTLAHLPDVQLHPFHLGARELATSVASPWFLREHLGLPDEAACFILLADPFSTPAERLLAALDICFPGAPVIGGLASGGTRKGQHALLVGDRVEEEGCVGLALTGSIAVDVAVAQGCMPVGDCMRITKCQGNLLLELDERPATEALQALVPQLAASHGPEGVALFVGLLMDDAVQRPAAGDFLARNLLGMDPDEGVLSVGADLTLGQRMQFHVRDKAASSGDLRDVLGRLAGNEHAGGLLFTCAGRGEGLFGEPDHDSGVIGELLPGAAFGGFFCNGEIGPVGGTTFLHGYTASLAMFRRP